MVIKCEVQLQFSELMIHPDDIKPMVEDYIYLLNYLVSCATKENPENYNVRHSAAMISSDKFPGIFQLQLCLVPVENKESLLKKGQTVFETQIIMKQPNQADA